jgi:uncharacterized protein (TIGR02246 family)
MAAAHDKAGGEAQIRALLDEQIAAVRAKDVSGLLASYAPDVVVFDLVNPLQYRGSDALRNRAAEWLSSFEGPVGYEAREVRIMAGDDVAYCHSLNRVTGRTTQGKKIDMSWRATLCCRKIDGRWMVTHGHSSVPFDMESGQASLDLRP